MRLLCAWSGSLVPPSGASVRDGSVGGNGSGGNGSGNGTGGNGSGGSGAATPARRLLPYYPHTTAISTALIVSSCTKLFPILLIIWDYDLPSAASAVSWAVITNNVAAVEILMDCGFLRAAVLVLLGACCRAAVGYAVLSLVGLQDRAWGLDGVGVLLETVQVLGTWVGVVK